MNVETVLKIHVLLKYTLYSIVFHLWGIDHEIKDAFYKD